MGDSERDYLEKLSKIKVNSSKKVSEVLDVFGKALKLKADALGKNEEMMTCAATELEKLERKKAENKDLSVESQNRLNDEISATRIQIKQKYDELKARIAERAN